MKDSRLTLALEGADALPEAGRIAVYRAGTGADLSALPRQRVLVVQGNRAAHDAWAAQGYAVAPEAEGAFAGAVVILPRVRAEARALVADAALHVAPGGPIWIDGQKTDGIGAMLGDLRARCPVSEPISKAHGKAFRIAAPGPELFADWLAAPAMVMPGFVTLPGVFSGDGVDRGSALLAAALPARITGRVADLGAGWGWLSAQILAREMLRELHLIEAEYAALACARQNITDPRARFHWADVTGFRPEAGFDTIVTNPPFHAGRAADPGLGAGFIRAAARMLTPGGHLWLVANRHLPYERVLAECFGEVVERGGDGGFKVIEASRPVRVGKPQPATARRTVRRSPRGGA